MDGWAFTARLKPCPDAYDALYSNFENGLAIRRSGESVCVYWMDAAELEGNL